MGINGDWASDSNLEGYWILDNATTVTDLTSNSNDGTTAGSMVLSNIVLDKTSNNNDGTLL